MSELTAVTGATGFIGSHLVRQLLDEGARLRVLARRPERLARQVHERAEVVEGDVRDRRGLGAVVEGAHTVLHLAACVRGWSRDPAEFREVNVGAVEMLLEAAQRAGVIRLVHVSTVLTLPPYRPAPLKANSRRLTPYEETKRAGERLVESYAAAGHDAVIVQPTRVYGPGPLGDANATTRVVALYLAGRFRVRLRDGEVLNNYVHADDVAMGIRLAARSGRRGSRYVIGGDENLSFRALLALVDELSGRRRRVLALPPAVARAGGRAADLCGRLGGTPPLTSGWVRVLLEDRRADISPARRELGYRPRPLREGLKETIAWLSAQREESHL
ncbi:MAG: SDR family NAD(P)-dependent oxidoreductase [Gemmatimonadota bacterium]|nr:MAG: SDR family NAD(P)-dependent oxidoreductase [Gemmatimonadota bacterium]